MIQDRQGFKPSGAFWISIPSTPSTGFLLSSPDAAPRCYMGCCCPWVYHQQLIQSWWSLHRQLSSGKALPHSCGMVQWCRKVQDAAGRWAAGAWAARLSHRGPKQFNALACNTSCVMPRLCASWENGWPPKIGTEFECWKLTFWVLNVARVTTLLGKTVELSHGAKILCKYLGTKRFTWNLESESLLDGVPTLTIYWPCSLLWLHYSCCTLLSVPRVKLWGGHAKGELFTQHVKSSEIRGREYANNLYRVQLLKQQLAWLCQSAKSVIWSS